MVVYKITNTVNGKVYVGKTVKGLGHPLYGKHHSSETIEKMRLSALARWSKRVAI